MVSRFLTTVLLITVNVIELCGSAGTRRIISQLENKIARLEDKMYGFEERALSAQEKTITALQTTIDAQAKISHLERTISTQHETISALNKTTVLLTNRLKDTVSEAKLSRALQEYALIELKLRVAKNISALEETISVQEKNISTLNNELEAVRINATEAKQERALHENSLAELKLKVNSTDHKVKSLNNTVDTLTNGVLDLSSGLEAVRVNVTTVMDSTIPQSVLPESYADYTAEVDSLRNKVDTLTIEAQQFSSGLDTAKTNLRSTQEEVNELMYSAVRKDSDGTIPQSVLPGSYADYTVEDIMWGSIHMAVTAVCQDKVSRWGRVIPITPGSTCSTTCSGYSSSSTCGGVVYFKGAMRRSTVLTGDVGLWYNRHTCGTGSSLSEVSKDDGYILTYNYLMYCCCS